MQGPPAATASLTAVRAHPQRNQACQKPPPQPPCSGVSSSHCCCCEVQLRFRLSRGFLRKSPPKSWVPMPCCPEGSPASLHAVLCSHMHPSTVVLKFTVLSPVSMVFMERRMSFCKGRAGLCRTGMPSGTGQPRPCPWAPASSKDRLYREPLTQWLVPPARVPWAVCRGRPQTRGISQGVVTTTRSQ